MNKIASSATSRATAILAIITVAGILAFAAAIAVSAQSGAPDWRQAPTGLSVTTGNEAGKLDINWDTSSQDTKTLSDYRVTWKPDGEAFKHWGETDWNAFPTTNELTLTGLNAGETYQVKVRARYDDNKRSKWSDIVTAQSGVTPNTAATGQPIISGTAQVRQTLTAGTSSIADDNGLTNVVFSHQWVRSADETDTDIADATGSTYIVTSADAGYAIRVRASFTDDDGYAETLTSKTTAQVPGTREGENTLRSSHETEAPPGWSLQPAELNVGDQFRLIFLTSRNSTAQSTAIADYNTIVQTRAAAGHTNIQSYSNGFRVVGSTASVDARDNTSTRYTSSDKGVPVYWLDGAKVADNYEDFYDGSWDEEVNLKDESGNAVTANSATRVWTGSKNNGTKESGYALGNSTVQKGIPNNTASGHGPIDGQTRGSNNADHPFYALSEVFVVAGTTASTNATLSDLALADVDGNAVALDTTFASDDYEYEASVANSDSAVTLSATKNNSNATVAITGDDDTNTPNEAELGLNVGSNTLTVTVTAEDGSTTQTYTVTVTRAVEPGHVLVSKKVLTITEGSFGHYTLVLDREPTEDVNVVIIPPNPEVTLTPTTLSFTTSNWNTPQRVTVTALRDADTKNETMTLIHNSRSMEDSRFDGITIASLTVNVDDTEAPNYHLRSILVPYDLELGEKALPEEEINVWASYPFYQNMYVVAEGDRWSPSGVWADPGQDMIWVVDPIHFGIHALKLSALKEGRIERHIAADTTVFDYRFNYNCHFRRFVAGDHGNPSLTVMWGNDNTIWVANDTSGQLDAYRRNGSSASGCYTDNVTAWTSSGATTAREDFKTPFTRDSSNDYSLTFGSLLTVWGIWSDGTKIWVGGPGGIYTIDMDTGEMVKAPGFNGHDGGTYGLWSDGRTMWVATKAWLRAYHLNTGIRNAALDVGLHRNLEPDGMWSDGETIWVTHRSGSIEAYRLR